MFIYYVIYHLYICILCVSDKVRNECWYITFVYCLFQKSSWMNAVILYLHIVFFRKGHRWMLLYFICILCVSDKDECLNANDNDCEISSNVTCSNTDRSYECQCYNNSFYQIESARCVGTLIIIVTHTIITTIKFKPSDAILSSLNRIPTRGQ